MKTTIIYPSSLSGVLRAPASKSLTHRAIVAACLSKGTSVLKNVAYCNDVLETLNAFKVFGVDFEFSGNVLKIFGGLLDLDRNQVKNEFEIRCLESASTVRFLVPLVAALGLRAKFIVGDRLFKRFCLSNEFLFCEVDDRFVIKINKILKPGCFYFENCKTSQFVSGLLLILPVLKQNSLIIFGTELESNNFVELTVSFLTKLGIKIQKIKNGFKIPGCQVYEPFNYTIEGDFSLCSFFAVAGCFNKIVINGLSCCSAQGELQIVNILQDCGAKAGFKGFDLVVQPGSRNLKYFEINLKNNIDLAPILAVLASFCCGCSKLFGVSRLKFKESNRINSILDLINGLGGKADFFDDCIQIEGFGEFLGGVVNCCGDHRIAMAAAIASCKSRGKVVLKGAECVAKSWPGFFESFKKLGGVLDGFGLE